ncbi:MAG: hypothetical protein HC866_15700 [Leptolyngbyaceae cyanobacterium RU_5_1]|nr:hypothetical protein [Leptolyngbyaceae cyanobacterium RU_5_1]
MKEGDLVRLKQPFRPEADRLEEYNFGIVAGLIQAESEADELCATGVILYLYNSQTSEIYRDASGIKALFYFKQNEVELS